MNKTLIIYDLKGTIFYTVSGFYNIPEGLPFIEVEIPDGKYPKSINAETQEVIYEDLPVDKTERFDSRISALEAENKSLKEGLQAVLNGDMQSLAYILYPEDFTNINKSNTTLEL